VFNSVPAARRDTQIKDPEKEKKKREKEKISYAS
jgi:hypothetical protein